MASFGSTLSNETRFPSRAEASGRGRPGRRRAAGGRSARMAGTPTRHARSDVVLPQPACPRYRLAHIGFFSPGGPSRNKDKDKHGHRYDSVGICNGVIHAGASCVRFAYDPSDPERMIEELKSFDGYIVRINPGQLSNPGVAEDAQRRFDDAMRRFVDDGKPVWSSPAVQSAMGAKDALVKIKGLRCGLECTRCYYDAASFEEGFRTTAAFQPRVLKRNRGSAGEGVWLVWLRDKSRYCARLGDRSLEDSESLVLMEMCDNHVEEHTVREFLAFCVKGADAPEAGTWRSNHPGGFFRDETALSAEVSTCSAKKSSTAAAVHVVDQRLLPRIVEGEVRLLMVRDSLYQIVHKKPREGGMSAVGTLVDAPSYFEPDAPEYAALRNRFVSTDLPRLKRSLGLETEPLPLLWTADFIPRDGDGDGDEHSEECPERKSDENEDPPFSVSDDARVTEWSVGEFNCSCVGVSPFLAAAGVDRDMTNVSDEDYERGMRLCDMMGEQVVQALDERRAQAEAARGDGGAE